MDRKDNQTPHGLISFSFPFLYYYQLSLPIFFYLSFACEINFAFAILILLPQTNKCRWDGPDSGGILRGGNHFNCLPQRRLSFWFGSNIPFSTPFCLHVWLPRKYYVSCIVWYDPRKEYPFHGFKFHSWVFIFELFLSGGGKVGFLFLLLLFFKVLLKGGGIWIWWFRGLVTLSSETISTLRFSDFFLLLRRLVLVFIWIFMLLYMFLFSNFTHVYESYQSCLEMLWNWN